MIYWWFLVIFLTALSTMLITWRLTDRPERPPCTLLADPAPLPGDLPRSGRFDVTWQEPRFTGESRPVDLQVLADALTIAERQASQDEVARSLAIIELEVELNPEKYGWRVR